MSLSTEGVGAKKGPTFPTATRVDLPGVRCTLRRIIGVTNTSGRKPNERFNNPVDLGLKIEVPSGFDSWNLDFDVFGNLARDKATGEVTGFGSAFKPVGLINRLGTNPNREKLTDDFQLRRHWVDDLVGKDVVILEYVYKKTDDGYLRYLVYDVVEAVGRQPEATEDFDPEVDDFQGAAERLMARFMEDLADGYPKAYRPGLVTSGQAETAAVGRSAATDPFAGAPTSQPASFEPDDDLPF